MTCPSCGAAVREAIVAGTGATILLDPERHQHAPDESGYTLNACCDDHEPVARELHGLNLYDLHVCPGASS